MGKSIVFGLVELAVQNDSKHVENTLVCVCRRCRIFGKKNVKTHEMIEMYARVMATEKSTTLMQMHFIFISFP